MEDLGPRALQRLKKLYVRGSGEIHQRSMRGLAKDLHISPRTMRRVVKEDLGLSMIFRTSRGTIFLTSEVEKRLTLGLPHNRH